MQVAKLTKAQTILIVMAVVYLLIGTTFGFILKSAIPAVNAWGVIYYAVFTPVGCVMRLFGQDLLEEGWDAKASSYWTPKEPQTDLKSYERMF